MKFKIFILFFFLFLIFASDVSAQVVINEFSSWESSGDWVELYSDEDVDISGWILRDTASTVVNTIPSEISIGPSTSKFFIIGAKNRLNKNEDIIKLYKEDDSTLVNQVSYGDEADVCVPNQGQSAGRFPDGTGSFVRFASHTEGTTNTSSQDPCPTPTPEPATPEPAKQTASPSPSESPSSTPKPTVKAAATKKPTSKPKVIEEESDENGEDFILGLREELETDAPSSESEGKKKFPILAGLFIVGGLGVIGFAGFSFIKNKRKTYNNVKDGKKGTVDDNNQQSTGTESL